MAACTLHKLDSMQRKRVHTQLAKDLALFLYEVELVVVAVLKSVLGYVPQTTAVRVAVEFERSHICFERVFLRVDATGQARGFKGAAA